MAEMSCALGEQADAKLYDVRPSPMFRKACLHAICQEHAATLTTSWYSLTLSESSGSESHLLGSYGDEGSWALMYNIYADRLLGTGIVNEIVRCR